MSFKKYSDPAKVEVLEDVKEECYILLGDIYTAKIACIGFSAVVADVQHTGTFAGVDFDYKKVYEFEDAGHKVIGFLHTHPQTSPDLAYSKIDAKTMKAWCSCLGRNLLCAIATCDLMSIDVFLFSKQGYEGQCILNEIVEDFTHFPEALLGYLPDEVE